MISNDKQMDLFTTETNADGLQVSGSHYKDMEMQPWTVMEAVLTKDEFVGYLKGNIIKYAMRQGKKEGSDDAGKARHYKQKLNEVLWQHISNKGKQS